MTQEIQIKCTGEFDVDWHELQDLQTTESGKRIKSTDNEKIEKLVASLIEFGLVNNLQIWIDPSDETKYCFDAHHRRIAFERLEELGYMLPLIPATRCLADDRISAKQLLIIKESKSSWVMPETIEEYLVDIGMTLDVANEYIDLPDIDFDELMMNSNVEVNDLLDSDFIMPDTEIKGRDIYNKITIFVSDKGKKTLIKELKKIQKTMGTDIRIMK